MADNWRTMIAAGHFVDAEPLMLEETTIDDGFDAEARAEFYEKWGDSIESAHAAEGKYRTSHYYWAIFASWSTSGGEGTARMRDANRVLIKLEALRSKASNADR